MEVGGGGGGGGGAGGGEEWGGRWLLMGTTVCRITADK